MLGIRALNMAAIITESAAAAWKSTVIRNRTQRWSGNRNARSNRQEPAAWEDRVPDRSDVSEKVGRGSGTMRGDRRLSRRRKPRPQDLNTVMAEARPRTNCVRRS